MGWDAMAIGAVGGKEMQGLSLLVAILQRLSALGVAYKTC